MNIEYAAKCRVKTLHHFARTLELCDLRNGPKMTRRKERNRTKIMNINIRYAIMGDGEINYSIE